MGKVAYRLYRQSGRNTAHVLEGRLLLLLHETLTFAGKTTGKTGRFV